MAEHDLIVVGAGPFGLIAAHTWLSLHPDDSVLILEDGPDLGGVWAKSRVYPTMMTQTPVGMFEYSSFPMPSLPSSETYHDYFPGHHVTDYLTAFASHKLFSGKTIADRILFSQTVKSITKSTTTNLWTTTTFVYDGPAFLTKKLIIATGLTSLPNIPTFPTTYPNPSNTSELPIIHTLNLASSIPLLSSPDTNHVVILGGSKSAFDAVTLLSTLSPTYPKKITWIIRPGGQGPALLSFPSAPWPMRNSHEIISTRFVSKMSPCIFDADGGDMWEAFWHRNTLGRWLCDGMWAAVDWSWRAAAGYKDGGESMRLLEPEKKVFWSSDGVAVVNSERMWDAVKGARVLRDEVVGVQGKEVVLRGGETIECDAIVAATGWRNVFPFLEGSMAERLGLPRGTKEGEMVSEDAKWKLKIEEAEKKVLVRFPKLRTSPKYASRPPKSTPSYLYRGITPIRETGSPVSGEQDHSIAFLGTYGTTQSFLVAEIQSLWAAAYLSGDLKMPSEEEMKEQVALAIAWRRKRYLGDGYTLIFEQLQYTSMLLRDLGIEDKRKGGAWSEISSPYRPSDYRGILEEWKGRQVAS